MGVASPSVPATIAGGFVMEGLKNGISDATSEAVKAATEAGTSVI